MIHRECGVLKTTYAADMALYPLPVARKAVAAIAVLFVLVAPLVLDQYYLSIINLIFIASVGAIGLNILVGYTGQIWVGHGAFMSVGAYTAANFAVRLGFPFWVSLPLGGMMAALIGAIVGIPSLRIKGLYLAIATLAAQFIMRWSINHFTWISGGIQACHRGAAADAVRAHDRQPAADVLLPPGVRRAGHCGRAEPHAQPDRTRLYRDSRSGYRGAEYRHRHLPLQAPRVRHLVVLRRCNRRALHLFLGIANYEQFQIGVSIDYLAMIIIGGLGSVLGSILGAVFITLLPIVIRWTMESFWGAAVFAGSSAQPHPEPPPDPVRVTHHLFLGGGARRTQSALAQYSKLFQGLAVRLLS